MQLTCSTNSTMTTDEVILRRQRSSSPGNGGQMVNNPRPTPIRPTRGQSTYMALLSSLATDLDLMLNDLRSTPSSRFLQPLPPLSAATPTVSSSLASYHRSSNDNENLETSTEVQTSTRSSNHSSVSIVSSQRLNQDFQCSNPYPYRRQQQSSDQNQIHQQLQQQTFVHSSRPFVLEQHQHQYQASLFSTDNSNNKNNENKNKNNANNKSYSGNLGKNFDATSSKTSSSRTKLLSVDVKSSAVKKSEENLPPSATTLSANTLTPFSSSLSFYRNITNTTSTTTFTNGSNSAALLGSIRTSTSDRNSLWSTESTTPHQPLKSRRLPYGGNIDSGSGSADNIAINDAGGGAGGKQNKSIADNNKSLGDNFNPVEADESCCGDGLMEDDLQALLPNCRQLSRDELSQSRASLVSSSDGGVLAEGETSSETSEGSTSPPCDLGLIERLLRTHPVWFLPGIQRAGAVHLLQGKEEGNFIVRGSSQPNTMAVSVRLPPDTGPYIEHYLIQSNEAMLSLESSRFKFDSIPALIAHYAQCCDELPVQLVLPRALREAKNRQQLSSLALLGQEFWRYPMANPKQNTDIDNIDIKSPNSLTDSSGIGTTIFSSSNNFQQKQQMPQQLQHQKLNQRQHQDQQQQHMKLFSPTNPLGGIFSQAGTPSDTTSSLSSFTTSTGQNHQLMSPESVDSIILTSPVELSSHRLTSPPPVTNSSNQILSKLTTFKSSSSIVTTTPPLPPARPSITGLNNNSNCSNNNNNSEKLNNLADQVIRTQRPTPPNTLNLAPLRTPPAPPVRWSKPLTPISPVAAQPSSPDSSHASTNNFTVTTTVTFSVDNKTPQQFVEVMSPNVPVSTPLMSQSNNNNNNTTFQTFSKRLSPEGECKTGVDTLSSQGSSNKWNSQSSKDSNQSQRKVISPNSNEAPSSNSSKQRRSKARKESKHYQESDILESPQIYCRSALGDKISDYEDIWSQDTSLNSSTKLSTFKPGGVQGKRPDLLPETRSIGSSTNPSPPLNPKSRENSGDAKANYKDNNNDKNFINGNPTKSFDITSPMDSNKNLIQSINTTASSPMVESHQFINVQPRNRLGLMLPLESDDPTRTLETDTITPTTSTPVNQSSRSKQGSPFYAEPADALRAAAAAATSSAQQGQIAVLRRSQRGILLPPNHRHSEPPKSGIVRSPICPVLVPSEIEKIAGSLDELKRKQQEQQLQQQAQQQQHHQQNQQKQKPRTKGRDPWPLDSSWEFMSKNDDITEGGIDYGDYDCEERWTGIRMNTFNSNDNNADITNIKGKPLTIHQIIAKRLPDLNLPELIRCSTPQSSIQVQNNENNNTHDINRIDNIISNKHSNINNNNNINNNCNGNNNNLLNENSGNNCGRRISSYDNVEKHISTLSYTTSFLNGIDSAQSDDGTVFSEPWDSSQWESFLPQDDNSDTIHLSKCRPAICSSEDDTLIDDTLATTKDNQGTLKANKSHQHHPKTATILRNRSIRDREILCHPRNKLPLGSPGESIRIYTLLLANDNTSTFSRNIENFIACTKESREAAPQVVMRNMRQFMNGMKNYLVKHGEGDFHQEVQKARSHLKSDEFLNLDAILESVMHQLVVLPLREHLYGMFVDYYTRSGDIQLLVENVKYACARGPIEFGIRASITPPVTSALHQISILLVKLQEAELPLDKLDLFLCVISSIFDATGCPRGQQLGADDFLPILVYVVAKCGFVGAEIEAEFMWGLLQPALLSGEAGYYLTALCSAVHVLKSFMSSENEGTGSLDWRSSTLPACSSVLRVIIPDECNGSLQTRTLPVRPHTTTKEVCRIIAHKARITNPQDYGLFKLVDGEETLLAEAECPQDARIAARGKHCMLAYKRIDAKIAWPTVSQLAYT